MQLSTIVGAAKVVAATVVVVLTEMLKSRQLTVNRYKSYNRKHVRAAPTGHSQVPSS